LQPPIEPFIQRGTGILSGILPVGMNLERKSTRKIYNLIHRNGQDVRSPFSAIDNRERSNNPRQMSKASRLWLAMVGALLMIAPDWVFLYCVRAQHHDNTPTSNGTIVMRNGSGLIRFDGPLAHTHISASDCKNMAIASSGGIALGIGLLVTGVYGLDRKRQVQ
jgi:hypothetical protein